MDHEEEFARFRRTVLTREETRAEADALFGGTAARVRKEETARMRKLFVQAPAAQTMAPILQGESEKRASVAPNVDAFMSKIAEAADPRTFAQKRYPELMKVAAPRAGTFMNPSLPPRKAAGPTVGEVPARSPVSGGSA